jgi:hypothetical protein
MLRGEMLVRELPQCEGKLNGELGPRTKAFGEEGGYGSV